jgi:hypothetical protein
LLLAYLQGIVVKLVAVSDLQKSAVQQLHAPKTWKKKKGTSFNGTMCLKDLLSSVLGGLIYRNSGY